MADTNFITRAQLVADLGVLGIVPGDTVMVHAAMRQVGELLNGPDALIHALRDVVGPNGTVMAYCDWDGRYEDLCDDERRVPENWRDHIPPFDPQTSRSIRDNGAFPEFLRTTPGALRSASPGASMAAIGARAQWLTQDHPIDYGYGEGSPLAKLCEVRGKVLNVGAPRDTMTLLHHAEHLAEIPGKRFKIYDVPFATPQGTVWRRVEEFDTGDPVIEGLADDYFADIVTQFLATGQGRVGKIGLAESLLVPAAEITAFAVDWLESRFGAR